MGSLRCRGAIFDLDGVITQTARVHFEAWKKTFDEYLDKKTKGDFEPFTHDGDYVPYVDGKPRYDGVKSFLESRGVEVPFGDTGDTPDKETICGLGNKKNVAFRHIVETNGVDLYKSSVDLIKKLLKSGVQVGVASSSKNCAYILKKLNLDTLFETIVDGIVSKEMGLNGKPQPDIFITAANNMGLKFNECMMVEDAISGVQAGRNGNFALVLGVARHGDASVLKNNGADIVVNDLSEISLEDINEWFEKGIKKDSWNFTYHGFDPDQEKLRETLTTVGNGYFGTRGCFSGTRDDDDTHYPGTYIAGLYNKLPTEVHGKTIYNNDFVNCPNWLLIELAIGDDDIQPLKTDILSYKHNLNLKDAVVSREIVFKDDKGRVTKISTERIASMDDPHYGAIKYKITPQNYSEKITLRSALNGTVINNGVPRYRSLKSKHITHVRGSINKNELRLHVRTNKSKVDIYMTAKHHISRGKIMMSKREAKRSIDKSPRQIAELITFNAKKGSTYSLEKMVSIYTSHDLDIKKPLKASKSALSQVHDYYQLFDNHKNAWRKLWDKADFVIGGDRFSQKAIRLHVYHLLVSASIHNANIDAGMTARGLHGEAYRGHIFWDELFVFPFFDLHFPEITKSLLMYRYRRLDAARKHAKKNGYEGAMFPWQTADGGEEETQIVHYNPMSGKWDPDLSCHQRHVSIAIAYNVWVYYYCTNDLEFLYKYGAEIMIEITRFWASIAKYDKTDDRYHIHGVMGPDEFHEKYHNSKKPGISDNAYTNIMASWLMHKTVEIVEHIPEDALKKIAKKVRFKYIEVEKWKNVISDMPENYFSEKTMTKMSKQVGVAFIEIEKWKDIVRKMYVAINKDGIISQFDGYMDLEELDWAFYREKYKDIHRLDRILKSEDDNPDRYKVAKQADVLMLFYALSPGQVRHVLDIMGYDIGDALEFMKKNYEYYIKRTSHGSTLSHVVHSAILKYSHTHKKEMWEWFLSALSSDIIDIQGGTTAEGIHSGVMGGTIDILVKSFSGMSIFKDYIKIEPDLPQHWHNLNYKIIFKGIWISFKINQKTITVKHIGGTDEKLRVQVGKKNYIIKKQESVKIPYHTDAVILSK
ncbi:beta-phosphoglucomutase family hydrolase [Candidatus Margulisiibacteriota bacterium]